MSYFCCLLFMCVNVCPTTYVFLVPNGVREDLLGLELQRAVSHHVGSGNGTPILYKTKCSNH